MELQPKGPEQYLDRLVYTHTKTPTKLIQTLRLLALIQRW